MPDSVYEALEEVEVILVLLGIISSSYLNFSTNFNSNACDL